MKRCILVAGLFLTASTMAETIPYWRISSGWAEPGDADLSIVGIDVGEFNYDAGWIIEGVNFELDIDNHTVQLSYSQMY